MPPAKARIVPHANPPSAVGDPGRTHTFSLDVYCDDCGRAIEDEEEFGGKGWRDGERVKVFCDDCAARYAPWEEWAELSDIFPALRDRCVAKWDLAQLARALPGQVEKPGPPRWRPRERRWGLARLGRVLRGQLVKLGSSTRRTR